MSQYIAEIHKKNGQVIKIPYAGYDVAYNVITLFDGYNDVIAMFHLSSIEGVVFK